MGLDLWERDRTNQCLHCSVQRMPVVPPELGVGALERWVSVRLGLLDTARVRYGQSAPLKETEFINPFRCAFRLWLCCEEFFDSVEDGQPVAMELLHDQYVLAIAIRE